MRAPNPLPPISAQGAPPSAAASGSGPYSKVVHRLPMLSLPCQDQQEAVEAWQQRLLGKLGAPQGSCTPAAELPWQDSRGRGGDVGVEAGC
jgi:hypothetical protein